MIKFQILFPIIVLFTSIAVNAKCRLCAAIVQDNAVEIELILEEFDTIARLNPFVASRLDEQDDRGNSPLHHCVKTGNMVLFKRLVAEGANLHQHNVDGLSPLGMALLTNDNEALIQVAQGVADSIRSQSQSSEYFWGWVKTVLLVHVAIGALGGAVALTSQGYTTGA
jgi:hypothetical protein